MTMVELQEALGTVLQDVLDDNKTEAQHAKALAQAEAAARIAKQMINNADVILRADKLAGRHERIDKVVG